MHDPPLPEARHLHAAAAHVEEGPVLHGKPPHRSQEAVSRLFLAAQDAYVEAEALLDLGHEGLAVLRVADGGGGQGKGARGPGSEGDGPEVLEGLVGPLLGFPAQAVGRVQLAHQAQRPPAAGQDLRGQAPLEAIHHDARRSSSRCR